MKEEWFALYESLLKELEKFREKAIGFMAEIEGCFNLAQQYWIQAERKLQDHHFLSEKEEIEFYKLIKPLFKSHIEYYNLLYHAELFKPTGNPGEMKEFWIKEQLRLDKFILDNTGFYNYYKSKSTYQDEIYFLSSGLTVYYDDLIATLFALERYSIYTRNQLSRL